MVDNYPVHLNIGDLIEDHISGKRGVVLEIKKWSYNTTHCDVYVHWLDGEKFWTNSAELVVISDTEGMHNAVVQTKHDLVVTITAKGSSLDEE